MNKKISVLLLLFWIVSGASAQVKTEWLATFIDKQRADWNVPGVAFGLIKDDSLIFTHGSGVCKEGGKEKTDANTMFGIASNSKAFTAAAIALLVEEGKLKWNDKVTTYLPWFALYDDYVTREFTIKDLLTHHSGLATFSGDAMWYASTLSRTDIIKRAKYLKPVTGFRTDFGYSNIMYLTAGEIVKILMRELNIPVYDRSEEYLRHATLLNYPKTDSLEIEVAGFTRQKVKSYTWAREAFTEFTNCQGDMDSSMEITAGGKRYYFFVIKNPETEIRYSRANQSFLPDFARINQHCFRGIIRDFPIMGNRKTMFEWLTTINQKVYNSQKYIVKDPDVHLKYTFTYTHEMLTEIIIDSY